MAERSDTLAAPEAERALLGAILIEPTLAPPLLDQVAAADFYDTRHETLWDVYAACVKDGVDPDLVTVTDRLRRHHETALMGYLPLLVGDQVSLTQVDRYAETIVDYSRRRRLAALGMRLNQAAHNGTDPITAYGNAMDALDADVKTFTGGPTATVSTGRRDLAWVLDGTQPEIVPPVYGRRDDGISLFYSGRVNGIYGDPESAKTWLAMVCVVEALIAGHRAAIVDVDHNGQDLVVDHLLRLGAYFSHIGDPDRFYYAEPDDRDQLRACVADLAEWGPAVAVLDSIGEMLPIMGAESADNDTITLTLRAIAKPLADAGVCVITIDHQAKAKDARQGFAIGGMAKKRAMDGTLIHAETRLQPADGQLGKIHLHVEKDRPGRLRAACEGKWVGVFTLDSRQPNITTTAIEKSTVPTTPAGDFRPTHLMEEVSRYLEAAGQPRSGKNITDDVKGRPANIRAAIARLIEEDHITTTPGSHNATMHHLKAIYREAEDRD